MPRTTGRRPPLWLLALGTLAIIAGAEDLRAQEAGHVPLRGQTPEQTALDQQQCAAQATAQTGFNPSGSQPATGTKPAPTRPATGKVAGPTPKGVETPSPKPAGARTQPPTPPPTASSQPSAAYRKALNFCME